MKPLINRGITNEEILERYLNRVRNEYAESKDKAQEEKHSEKPDQSPTTLSLPASINPADYIHIPQADYLIAKYEPDWIKGLAYETAHKKVLGQGLHLPTPAIFMAHFLNVNNASHNKDSLLDGNNQLILRNEIEDIYRYLTITLIFNAVRTRLNARFVKGTGFYELDLETVTGLNSNGDLLLYKAPLEKCIGKDCYVDFKCNHQGLAI